MKLNLSDICLLLSLYSYIRRLKGIKLCSELWQNVRAHQKRCNTIMVNSLSLQLELMITLCDHLMEPSLRLLDSYFWKIKSVS